MTYELKAPILGFEKLHKITLEILDESFAKLSEEGSTRTTLTLINPFVLREYAFEIPTSIETLLNLSETSHMKIFCPVVLQTPIEESKVNFLAPIVFNDDNQTAAQVILASKDYPDFGVAQSISAYTQG